MQNDNQLLDLILKDQALQKDIYKPGPYWRPYAERTIRAIRSAGIDNFRATRSISKGFGDFGIPDPFDPALLTSWKGKLLYHIVNLPFFKRHVIAPQKKISQSIWDELQKFRDVYFSRLLGNWFIAFEEQYKSLPDTLVGNPKSLVTINNKTIGEKYIQSFLRIQNYSNVVDFSEVRSIFEIGGGFGATAHSLLHLYPNIRKYLYLDIPPQLYIATQYLKYHFGKDVIDYHRTSQLDKIEFSTGDKREIIAIPPWEIEKVDAKIGLFWNCASFQEMTPDIIANYIQHMDRILGDDDSKLCIMICKQSINLNKFNPNVVAIEDLLKIVRSESRFALEELEPEINIKDFWARYFVGTRCK